MTTQQPTQAALSRGRHMSEQSTELVDPDATTNFPEDEDPESLVGEEVN